MITHSKVKLDFSSQNISSDGGIVLLEQFLNKHIKSKLEEIPFIENRKNPKYSNTEIMYSRMINNFCGYNNQVEAEKSRDDKLLSKIIKTPSQPTHSRLYNRVSGFTNSHMNGLILETVKPLLKEQSVLIFDADSTYVECNGKQELSTRNAHYNCHGYNPIFITEHNTKTILAAELKPGNTVCSEGLDGLLDFLHEEIDLKNKKIIFRADSAFSNKKHIDLYEKYGYEFTVKMKRNRKMVIKIDGDMIQKLVRSSDVEEDKEHYLKVDYESPTYGNLKLYVKGTTKLEEQILLFPEYQVVVSNIDDEPENIFKLYNDRACSENIFRELKSDFKMDTLSHSDFEKNRFDFLFSCLNYNLFRLFKNYVAPEIQSKTLGIFMREFIKIGTKISTSSRQCKFSFSACFRYKRYFETMFSRL